jgi:hypothetical protein
MWGMACAEWSLTAGRSRLEDTNTLSHVMPTVGTTIIMIIIIVNTLMPINRIA